MTEESGENKSEEINQLQIPQKLQVVIDPWEMDGKGQIYSEQYIIKNTGKTAGILILSDLACKTGKNSGVVVKKSTQGLHDDEKKSVYMELMIDGKEKTVLSKNGSEYETEMKPGEELSLNFSGEVNENASKGWKDGDISVTVTYSWKAEAIPGETDEQPEKDRNEPEKTENDIKLEEVEEGSLSKETEYDVQSEEEKKEQNINISEAGETEFSIDTWETDEDGKVCSVQYTVKNTDEATGKLILSDFVCETEEKSGIAICTDKEILYDGEDKCVCMELMIPGEKNFIIPHKKEESFEYETELKAGEELTFRIVGELNGVSTEKLEKGDIEVKGLCSWITGKSVSEMITAEETAETELENEMN